MGSFPAGRLGTNYPCFARTGGQEAPKGCAHAQWGRTQEGNLRHGGKLVGFGPSWSLLSSDGWADHGAGFPIPWACTPL